MIGVYIECDQCRHYVVRYKLSVTDAKRLARMGGWQFGKKAILCPTRKAKKRKKGVQP